VTSVGGDQHRRPPSPAPRRSDHQSLSATTTPLSSFRAGGVERLVLRSRIAPPVLASAAAMGNSTKRAPRLCHLRFGAGRMSLPRPKAPSRRRWRWLEPETRRRSRGPWRAGSCRRRWSAWGTSWARCRGDTTPCSRDRRHRREASCSGPRERASAPRHSDGAGPGISSTVRGSPSGIRKPIRPDRRGGGVDRLPAGLVLAPWPSTWRSASADSNTCGAWRRFALPSGVEGSGNPRRLRRLAGPAPRSRP